LQFKKVEESFLEGSWFYGVMDVMDSLLGWLGICEHTVNDAL
jgi:hypothetical protein